MKPIRLSVAAGLLAAAVAVHVALAWHAPGHDRATRAALTEAGQSDLPAFLVSGADLVAHCSIDPDNFTRPIAAEPLHSAEAPEHYFDVELVADVKLPPTRYEFLQIVYARKLKPAQVGLLPYAVTEWTGRLTVALAEHRRWPDDPSIQSKCRVYAGILAHYAADLCQPLHTTIHYDGRVGPDGTSPRSGIHHKVDALIGKLSADDVKRATADLAPVAFDDVFAATLAEIARSQALVDRVYELEPDLPAYGEPLAADSPAARFARDRLGASVRFAAALFLTAWRDSAKVTLPEWHHRPPRPPTTQPE